MDKAYEAFVLFGAVICNEASDIPYGELKVVGRYPDVQHAKTVAEAEFKNNRGAVGCGVRECRHAIN